MTVTADSFKELFPEFNEVPDTRVDLWVQQAALFVDPDFWGAKNDLAQSLYAAHLLVYIGGGIDGKGNGANPAPVRRERMGEAEIEYANNGSDTLDALSSTSYGLAYLSLRKTMVITPRVIGC